MLPDLRLMSTTSEIPSPDTGTTHIPREPGDDSSSLTAELVRLRERFTSYEQLDAQFEEMLSGLTNLLEGAAELRRRTHHEVAASLARCEELVARERSNHRQNLGEIQNTLSEMQSRANEI